MAAMGCRQAIEIAMSSLRDDVKSEPAGSKWEQAYKVLQQILDQKGFEEGIQCPRCEFWFEKTDSGQMTELMDIFIWG